MAAAIPDYMKFGAVREMHGKSAAGTALDAKVEKDGRTSFSALIVDPIAIKKVETGTYKGFSIGGRVTSRDATDNSIITGLNLIEVSLVDRPANPEALITMYKADDIDKEVDAVAVDVVAEVVAEAEEHEDADDLSVKVKETTEEKNEVVSVEKAGAKFSAQSAAAIGEIHKMAKDVCAKFEGWGYRIQEDDSVASSASTDLEKAEAINKFDDLQKAFDVVQSDLAKANARIVELESQPETPKAILKSVDKGEDAALVKKAAENPHAAGTDAHAEWMIKTIHRNTLIK